MQRIYRHNWAWRGWKPRAGRDVAGLVFKASVGMYIGGYVAKFCKEQSILYEYTKIELSRRIEANSMGTNQVGAKPPHTVRIDAKIQLRAKLSYVIKN